MQILALTLCAALLPQAPATNAAEVPSDDVQAHPGKWSQWRGADRSGIDATRTWPDRLTDENFVQEWRIPLGPSYSGPIVDSERVYTTATVDKADELVRAVDRTTGETVWEVTWKGSMKVPFFASRNGSWIRATPALSDGKLYVGGILDVLVCLEAETGKELWRVDFKKRYGTNKPQFGAVSSPLVMGDHVFVQAGDSFLKLDAATGESIWRTLFRDESEGTTAMTSSFFSSPVLATVAGTEQFLVQTREELTGIDPADGKLLWRQPVKTFRGMNILTPQPWGENGVFTSTYGGRAHLYEVTKTDEGFTVEEAWQNRAQGYMTSPVVIEDHAYLYLRSQRFACVDLKSGEEAWISDPIKDEYWSLVGQGERMLALSEAGELSLIQHDPSGMKVVDKRTVSESETWAHLCVDGDQIIIREQDGLAAYRWR